jgi:FixJ family two-component response regulator
MVKAALPKATVYVVDDDESVRRAIGRLLKSAGLDYAGYASIEDFFAGDIASENACVIADIRLDRDDGMRIPGLLAERGVRLPVIFVTGSDSAELRARAQSLGAVALLRKPVDDQALLDVIRWGQKGR